MSAPLIAGTAMLAAMFACAAFAQPASLPEPAAPAGFAKPDRRIAAGGARRLHIRCEGSGSPTVILTAGLGDWGYAWRGIQSRLAESGRVCAWDRAGTGFSDPSPDRQDALRTTRDLERLLKRAGERPPYVLVGHSIGSFETLLFAFRNPSQVAGIVLVDPSSPFQYRHFERVAPNAFDHIDDAMREDIGSLRECIADADAARSGTGAAGTCLLAGADYPPELQAELNRINGNKRAARNLLSLSTSMDRSSRQLEAARRSLGSMPLVVLTAGKPLSLPDELQSEALLIAAEWRRMHGALARLSKRGTSTLVENAGHYIQLDRPDVVIGSITEVVDAARSRPQAQPQSPLSATTSYSHRRATRR